MSSSAHDLDTLNGNFKQIYADKLEDLIPEGFKLVNAIPFVARDKILGDAYNAPVLLQLEHGVTFANSGAGAFNLEAPISGQTQNAVVRGNMMVLRSALSYEAASKSQGSKAAFEDATKYIVELMLKSITKKLEIMLFYGQMGYGKIATAGVTGNVLTVATAEWAPGIWVGGEGMPIEIRDPNGVLRGSATITAVSMSARTLTLDAMPAGATDDDVIWHKGAYGKEFAGVHKIVSNTGSLFGIDAAAYSLWAGNSVPASGTLSFDEVADALTRAVEKGLEGKVRLYVNPRTWVDLLDELVAKRMFDSSYSAQKGEDGHERLVFHSQNGTIEVESSIYVKEGYAFILKMDEFIRVGSSDVTFKRPGKGDEFFKDLENTAGYELRCWSDQAVFCKAPGLQTVITGIVN